MQTLHERMSARLGVTLSDVPGPDPLAPGLDIWVGPKEIFVVDPDAGTVERFDAAADHFLIRPLLDRMLPVLEDTQSPRILDIVVSRDVPASTFIPVLYTLGRSGLELLNLVTGPAATPGAVLFDPRMDHIHGAPPVRELLADLSLAWTPDGLRAWALPRPAGHPPFDGGEEPPPSEDGEGEQEPEPSEIPLVLTAGADPPLTLADLRTLAASLCALDHGPLGVELVVAETTRAGDLLAAAVAATPPRDCHGPRHVYAWVDRSWRRSPVPLVELRKHLQARLPPPPDPRPPLPPHVSPSLPDDDIIK